MFRYTTAADDVGVVGAGITRRLSVTGIDAAARDKEGLWETSLDR